MDRCRACGSRTVYTSLGYPVHEANGARCGVLAPRWRDQRKTAQAYGPEFLEPAWAWEDGRLIHAKAT